MINYYQILGLESDASIEDIKRAYKKMIRLSHPDTEGNSNAIHMAQIVNEAYKILSDPQSKAKYDTELANKNNDTIPSAKSQTTTPQGSAHKNNTNNHKPSQQDYEEYNSYYGDVDNSNEEYNDTDVSLTRTTTYLQPLDTLHVNTIFPYIKLSVLSLVALVKYSTYIDGTRGKRIWAAITTASVIALALWGGVIGFVLAAPNTSIEWVGSSLSMILWLASWVFISLRAASSASKLSARIYNYETIKSTYGKVGTAFINTKKTVMSAMSGIWVLIQAVALMGFAFSITSGVWLRVVDSDIVIITGATLVIVSWAATVVASFIYAFKVENQRG